MAFFPADPGFDLSRFGIGNLHPDLAACSSAIVAGHTLEHPPPA